MRIRAGIVAMAVAIAAAGCGDEAERAPEITIARAAAATELDPAVASDHETLEALWLVYTPLLTYRHSEGESGEELIAGLATDLPEVSPDGRTYTLALRKDLVYSDGTPAVASDFERAVDRDLELGSPAAPYLREVADIETDDATGEITITLTQPDAAFPYALAMPATAPVPEGTPTADLSDDPPPGIGPYELETGENGFALVQSERFADLEIPDIPRGNLARIIVTVEPDDVQRTAQVLEGEIDSIQGPPAPALEAQIATRASERYAESPGPSTIYAVLDRDREPFNDPSVRRAIRLGVDSTGCSQIPPGLPGYDHDFDVSGCPQDVAAARNLVRAAGANGAPVEVAGDDARTAQYVRELRAIGLDARRGTSTEADTRVVRHFADTPEPFDFFFDVADEPVVAARLDAQRRNLVDGDWAGLERYVLAPPQAYLVPLAHERVTTLFSERMDPDSAYVHPIYGNDFTSWRI